jgi:transcription initiation factor TFIIIB Brf1 subunit/transcription initiation factor TFIIB
MGLSINGTIVITCNGCAHKESLNTEDLTWVYSDSEEYGVGGPMLNYIHPRKCAQCNSPEIIEVTALDSGATLSPHIKSYRCDIHDHHITKFEDDWEFYHDEFDCFQHEDRSKKRERAEQLMEFVATENGITAILSGEQIKDYHTHLLKFIDHLTTVVFKNCNITNQAIFETRRIKEIEHVEIINTLIDDRAIEQLKSNERLKSVKSIDNPFTTESYLK